MTDVVPTTALDDETAAPSRRAEALRIAGFASVGAGAIHAVAIGVHSEHDQVMAIFIAATVFQIGWGLYAALRPSRLAAAVLAAGNAALVAGWLMAVTSGISFVDGMEEAEPVELGNGLAAALALVRGARVHRLAPPDRRGRPRHVRHAAAASWPPPPSAPSC